MSNDNGGKPTEQKKQEVPIPDNQQSRNVVVVDWPIYNSMGPQEKLFAIGGIMAWCTEQLMQVSQPAAPIVSRKSDKEIKENEKAAVKTPS